MINLKAILEKAPEGATHYTDGVPSLNVYVKVVHLDGCYLYLAGKWERYPAYAELKSLDDLRHTLELQAERDALAAELTVLCAFRDEVVSVMNNSQGVAGWHKNHAIATWDELFPVVPDVESPQHHLRELRAEAVEQALDAVGVPCAQFQNQSADFTAGFNFCGVQVQLHADSIRQGGAS